jgi:hypothetical protein
MFLEETETPGKQIPYLVWVPNLLFINSVVGKIFVTKNQHFFTESVPEPGCIWAANGWRPACPGPRPSPAVDPGTAGPPTVAEQTGLLWRIMDYFTAVTCDARCFERKGYQ